MFISFAIKSGALRQGGYMKSIEKVGSTVEEAINEGLQELGLERNQVEIEVIEEGGLLKKSIVKLTTKPTYDEKAFLFLNELLLKMNVDCSARLISDENFCRINIEGSECAKIIGRRGETLDAIQYLTSIIASKDLPESNRRVFVDAEDFREKRINTLCSIANHYAEKALRTGKPIKLEPMTPSDRKTIHSAIQTLSGVYSVSEGVDPFRFVVIVPENFDYIPGKMTYHKKDGNRHGQKRRDHSDGRPSSFGTSASFRRSGFGRTRTFEQKEKPF